MKYDVTFNFFFLISFKNDTLHRLQINLMKQNSDLEEKIKLLQSICYKIEHSQPCLDHDDHTCLVTMKTAANITLETHTPRSCDTAVTIPKNYPERQNQNGLLTRHLLKPDSPVCFNAATPVSCQEPNNIDSYSGQATVNDLQIPVGLDQTIMPGSDFLGTEVTDETGQGSLDITSFSFPDLIFQSELSSEVVAGFDGFFADNSESVMSQQNERLDDFYVMTRTRLLSQEQTGTLPNMFMSQPPQQIYHVCPVTEIQEDSRAKEGKELSFVHDLGAQKSHSENETTQNCIQENILGSRIVQSRGCRKRKIMTYEKCVRPHGTSSSLSSLETKRIETNGTSIIGLTEFVKEISPSDLIEPLGELNLKDGEESLDGIKLDTCNKAFNALRIAE